MNKTHRTKIAALGLALFFSPVVAAFQTAAQSAPAVHVTPIPTPRTVATPTPTPTPTTAATPTPLQTVSDLTAKIRQRLEQPQVRRGQIGVKIVSLASGKTVFEQNAEKYFMPASNMKNFTVAAAIERLSPDFRLVTSVYAAALPGTDGTINGDVRIYGRGDVSISTAFADGNYYKGLDDLADKIVQAGVKRIEGNLIGDDSYFRGNALPGSWEWDDLQTYYGAEVSALPLNDNAIDLTVSPGPVGYGCTVKISPANLLIRVINQCTTGPAGSKKTLSVVKKLNQNFLEISGSLPAGDKGFSEPVAFTRPAELFVALLKERLALKGVIVTGMARTIAARPASAATEQVEIARLESVPFSLIAAKTMKPSQNMYTETILRTLGENLRSEAIQQSAPAGNGADVAGQDSARLGIAGVGKFLAQIGAAPDSIVQHDGSGLSRHNLITPAAVAALYVYMAKQSRYSQAWRDSLTIAGVDGTLRNRFAGTRAANNLRGKTGTIDQVSALSGYLTTAGGEELVVSFIVNGVPTGRDRTSLIDEIVGHLANFDGKID